MWRTAAASRDFFRFCLLCGEFFGDRIAARQLENLKFKRAQAFNSQGLKPKVCIGEFLPRCALAIFFLKKLQFPRIFVLELWAIKFSKGNRQMFILPTAKMKTPADNGVFCVDYLASPENGNPRNSKGMAGKLFKPCRFYAGSLAGRRRKNGACGAVKLWQIIND